MAIKSALLGLAGAGALIAAGTAPAAAGCAGVGNCDQGSVHSPAPWNSGFGPTTVHTGTPYDFMSSIRYQRAPHVEVTRIHGLGPVAGLKDTPRGNSGGCNAHATGYCYGHAGKPVSVELFNTPAPQPAPVFQPPVMQAPAVRAPVIQAPLFTPAPVPQERVVAVGRAAHPSEFIPRTYGSLDITPGIVHAPTSIVDRDPHRAQAALDRIAPGSVTPALSGVPIRHGVPYAAPYRLDPVPFAIPADRAPTGVVPGAYGQVNPSFGARPGASAPTVIPGPASLPSMPVPSFATPSVPVMQNSFVSAPAPQLPVLAGGASIPTGFPGAAGAPVPQADGTFASRVGADGTYWEQVSGVTALGNTVATSVICKRALPVQTVNPQVGVPFPVPVPVADNCAIPHDVRPYEARGRY